MTERETEESEITTGLRANPFKPSWVLLTLHVPECISNISSEVVNKSGKSSACLAGCPSQKGLNCLCLNWPGVIPPHADGGMGDTSGNLSSGHQQTPADSFWVVLHAHTCHDLLQTVPIFVCLLLAHIEIQVYRVLRKRGWLAKHCYLLADRWVEKACRTHPFICCIL